MSTDLIDARILQALDDGIPVIVSHRTQSRFLRYMYARYKKSLDFSAWPTPALYTWDDWVLHLSREIMWSGYVSGSGHRKLLTAGEEQLVWEKIVQRNSHDDLIDNLSGTASRAREAWALIQAWRLPDPKTAQFPNRDVRAYSQWMLSYFSESGKNNWLDQARLVDSVSPAIRAGAITPPTRIVLFGFDHFTPQQRVLLKYLENQSTQIELLKQKKLKGKLERVSFKDADAELDSAARWVRMILSQERPGVTGILIPDLDRNLDRVLRVFDDVLSPGSALPNSSLVGRPYTISVDRAFHRYRVVEAVTTILKTALTNSFFADVSSFLRSPLLRASRAELPMRARFELWLRGSNIDTTRPGELIDLLTIFAERHDEDAAQSVLSAVLGGLKIQAVKSRGHHPMSFWAQLFKDVLNVTGWPGDSVLNTVEMQSVERFREVLDELAGLDFLVPVCDVSQALSHLNGAIRRTSFRPRLPETQVQIMQPEEAYGLRFDQVWVAGWHSQNWPQAPTSNPFLPIEWQRQYKIPGVSSELQLKRAIALTEDICSSANQVVFSHAQASDEEELSESPLIQQVPAELVENFEVSDVTDYCEVIRAATDLIEFDDVDGPELSGVQVTRGGSSIFKLQSLCPFKAFAELRLGVKPWQIPRSGVSAIDKGNHLHKALEFIWEKIGGSELLNEVYNTEHLENQVYQEVELALAYQDKRRVRKLSGAVSNLEQQRLTRQILELLKIEKERPEFSVQGHEVSHSMRIGELNVDVRIDRVDTVHGGGTLLIDYKLGAHKIARWTLPRMEEPQLPLYAMAYEEPVSALAFLNGKPGEMGYRGLSMGGRNMGDGILPVGGKGTQKFANDWTEQLENWKASLEKLAADFINGRAAVNPIGPQTCRYCDLKSLCRIGSGRLRQESSDDD